VHSLDAVQVLIEIEVIEGVARLVAANTAAA